MVKEVSTMARIKSLPAKHATEVLDTNMYCKITSVHIPVRSPSSAKYVTNALLGMISHKKSQITIFGLKHKIKNFIKKFDISHKKNQQLSILVYISN